MTMLDDLELELRKLPGVRATGFTEREDVLLVQVHVGDEYSEPTLPLQATRIAYRHSDRPVAVELIRWRTREPLPRGNVGTGGPSIAAPTAESAASATTERERTVSGGIGPEPAPPAEPAAPRATNVAEPPRTPVAERAPEVPVVHEPPPAAAPAPPAEPPRAEPPPAEPPRAEPPRAEPPRAEPPRAETTFGTREGAPAAEAERTAREPAMAPGPAPGMPRVNRRSGSGPDEDRVRLLAVLTFPETDELEVHLTLQGRRTIGRAAASRGLLASVEATLDALGAFVPGLAYQPAWARTLETSTGEGFLVAAGLAGPENEAPRHGLASGSSAIEAAARATLQALNRSIALEISTTREHEHDRGESA